MEQNTPEEQETQEITLEQVRELYCFLQGELPPTIRMKRHRPKMSQQKAYNVIWFMQEHLRVLPDHFERCSNCGELYDSYSEGHHNDEKYPSKFYCGGCEHLCTERFISRLTRKP